MRKQVFRRKPGDLFGLTDKGVLFLLKKSKNLDQEIAKINKLNSVPVIEEKR